MTNIWLKYGNYAGTALNWGTATLFSATKVFPKFARKISNSTSLRGKQFVNKYYIIKSWDVTISANELTNTTKWTFLQNFFNADAWQISFDGNNFIDVVFNDEEMQLTYIDEIKFLPETKFVFIKKEPN